MAFVRPACKVKKSLCGEDPDTEQVFGRAPRTCSICGGPPTAYWSGQQDIGICLPCAINTMPRLLADAVAVAVVTQSADPGRVPTDLFAHFQGHFWQGLALALARMEGHHIDLFNFRGRTR